jgi:hypothetical protein
MVVLKNGVTIGTANVSTIIGGVIITGIKSLSFNFEQEKGNVEGFQQQPIARERKLYKYTGGAMEILLEEWKNICSAAPNRDPFQIAMFSLPIVYDNNAIPAETLGNVEFSKVGRTYKSGDGAIWQTVDFVYAGITQ